MIKSKNRLNNSILLTQKQIISQVLHEFTLIVKKDRKSDNIKLSSEFRNDILTAILRFYKEFADKPKTIQVS